MEHTTLSSNLQGPSRQPWLTTQTRTSPFRQRKNQTLNAGSQEQQSTPNEDFMRLIMEAQQEGMLQAQADRAAAAERIARLEDEILLLSVKTEGSPQPTMTLSLAPGQVDLQHFCTADGPSYVGPFQRVEPFLKWILAVQIFFALKEVTHNVDKICIVGSLIQEINMLVFYSNGIKQFVLGTWAGFKSQLFAFALPPLWRTKLRNQIQHLSMKDTKLFLTYSTQARTLQSMVNFYNPSFSDFTLAEFVVLGLFPELQALVNNFQLMGKEPFIYGYFEGRVQTFYNGLPKRSMKRTCGANTSNTATPSTQVPKLTQDKTIWQVHAYLDSQGRYHFCKKTCGSAPGACAGPINQNYIIIPSDFVAPPKPNGYKPPKAALGPPRASMAGKLTQAPAGQPSNQLATVAGAEDITLFPDLDKALVAAFQEIDEELCLAREEEYVSPPPKNQIVISLLCGKTHLRGLVDTRSEINLISEQVGLEICPLLCPKTIQLAMDNQATQPLILQDFALATLSDPLSDLTFPGMTLDVGPIVGKYDIILGTPFLSQFRLSVSISLQSLKCDKTGRFMFDY
ncbi:hypothetical protein PCANC_10538 [Puccinia coronata f. sp. avenae]|uniref:Uncharacterized protein n=1 Tax=Puccinia coronata f. sp. avenae TaxID=200324 RepID=A0A2N5VZ67_9BASI|nr:hypothetical protein PCANC_10538 [Puccinia coronata f. sp. avenae]